MPPSSRRRSGCSTACPDGGLHQCRLGHTPRTRYGAPYLTLHRADLHAALLAACQASGSVELKSGFEVTTIRQHEGHIIADSFDGGDIEGEALIGADGLWSAVRKSIDPRARLRFAGATASRALLPRADLPAPFDAPVVGLWLGPKAHLVHYPFHSGKNLNIVAVTEGGIEEQGWSLGKRHVGPAFKFRQLVQGIEVVAG